MWALCCGVSKLRGPEDGVLNVEGILRGKSKCGHRGPKIGQIQRKASTTDIKIVMQLIKLKSCKILQGWMFCLGLEHTSDRLDGPIKNQ